MSKAYWKQIGTVNVDTGMIVIADRSSFEYEDVEDMRSDVESKDGLVVKEFLHHHGQKFLDRLEVTTGFGDGEYPVFAQFVNFGKPEGVRITKVTVVFISDEEIGNYIK